MLHATITVELAQGRKPHESGRNMIRSRFRSDSRYEGNPATTTALELIEGIARALGDANINNVVSLLVDHNNVYIDTSDQPHDLEEMVIAAENAPALVDPYETIRLTASHEFAGLRIMLEIAIDEQLLRRQNIFSVKLSGRALDLQIIPGETPQAYAERIREWASQPQNIEQARNDMDQIVETIARVLRGALTGAQATVEPTTVRLVRPTEKQLGQLRHLHFGEESPTPRFRTVRADLQEQQKRQSQRSRRTEAPPSILLVEEDEFEMPERRNRKNRRDRDRSDRDRPDKGRSARNKRGAPEKSSRGGRKQDRKNKTKKKRTLRTAYVDHYSTYYFDPYWDFATFVLLDAMLFHHAWQLPYVHILDPWGGMLCVGNNVEDFFHDDPMIGIGRALDFDQDGEFYIDESISNVIQFDDGFYGDYGVDLGANELEADEYMDGYVDDFGNDDDSDDDSDSDDDLDDFGDDSDLDGDDDEEWER